MECGKGLAASSRTLVASVSPDVSFDLHLRPENPALTCRECELWSPQGAPRCSGSRLTPAAICLAASSLPLESSKRARMLPPRQGWSVGLRTENRNVASLPEGIHRVLVVDLNGRRIQAGRIEVPIARDVHGVQGRIDVLQGIRLRLGDSGGLNEDLGTKCDVVDVLARPGPTPPPHTAGPMARLACGFGLGLGVRRRWQRLRDRGFAASRCCSPPAAKIDPPQSSPHQPRRAPRFARSRASSGRRTRPASC